MATWLHTENQQPELERIVEVVRGRMGKKNCFLRQSEVTFRN